MSEKTTITVEMIVACYNSAKGIYPDRTKISLTAEKIHNETKMSKGSASDYLKDFFSMKDGKKNFTLHERKRRKILP